MAKRAVRRRRRIEELNRHAPPDTRPKVCAGEDCDQIATTVVNIDGKHYDVCDVHAELVAIQTKRRADYLREQGKGQDAERRRQTEEALGIRR